jgi:BarA-like signal transduction histidine kinase
MTVTSPVAQQRVLTATVGATLRRSLFWIGVVVVLAIIVLVTIAVAGGSAGGVRLSASNAAPAGARAVAEVLRQQGVRVVETSSLDETQRAISDRANTTLFIADENRYLDDGQLQRAVSLAAHVVIADPAYSELAAVAPSVSQAGVVTGTLTADCSVRAVENAGSATGGPNGYRVTGDATGVTACLGSGDKVYSLIQLNDGSLSVLGATNALTNEHVAEAGNAALALTLLGHDPTLVWYLPSVDDIASGAPADLGSLTPPWLIPVTILLGFLFVAAAVWRGRRLGPLVIENLPVTVRASETMLGRARLYEVSSSRLRALDALRIGTIARLAAACGLGPTASVDEIVGAVAALVGASTAEIARVLVDAVPSTDRELLRLSDELRELERAVGRAARP